MNILDLDEAQGLTREMVDRYLDRAGWCHMPDPEQRLLKPQYVHVSFKMGIGAAVERIASITGSAPQAFLREINPRMRKGMPSEAARLAHGETKDWLCISYVLHAVRFCWSVNDHVQMVAGTDVFSTERSEDAAMIERCTFWPCDRHGNKVRWPTDANGALL